MMRHQSGYIKQLGIKASDIENLINHER